MYLLKLVVSRTTTQCTAPCALAVYGWNRPLAAFINAVICLPSHGIGQPLESGRGKHVPWFMMHGS